MDAPATEGSESEERDRSATLGDGAPTAFVEHDPADLDDATELYLLDRYAAADGTVRVQLLGWERDGDVVRVAYALPTGERQHDRYRWPTAGRYDRSDFLALVRALGYSPAAADLVAGEFARARNQNGRWRIVTGRGANGEPDPDSERGADGGQRVEGPLREEGRAAASDAFAELGRRVRRFDPMAAGTASVVLFVLAVGVPASLATVTGGLTAASAAIGTVLFATAVTVLWLSIAAAA